MALFKPGRSGNPSGRPKSAAGLRAALLEKYGDNVEVLTDRLDRLSKSKNERTALESLKVLMAYTVGSPEQSYALSGKIEHGRYEIMAPDALSRLSEAQLDALAQLNGVQFDGTDVEPDQV